MRPKRFGVLGVAGYIAPRHLEAIRATGNEIAIACDPRDSVGVLDRYSLSTEFVPDEARFTAFMQEQRRLAKPLDFVSICSPNHLHASHCRVALRGGAHAICEKPLALTPEALDELGEIERHSGQRVFSVLQLRFHAELLALRERLLCGARRHHDVVLTYVTGRGPWYHASWKGNPELSGGVAMNIGIHLFDLLLWLFGPALAEEVRLSDPMRMAGTLELERASVRWFLSVDPADAAPYVSEPGDFTHRSMLVDGERIDFSLGFGGLHAAVYRSILAGEGLGIEDARPSVELTHRLRLLRVSHIDPEFGRMAAVR